MSVRVDTQHLSGFVGENEYKALAPQVKLAHEMLHSGTGLGNDFIGWVDLPTNYDKEEFARIKEAAKKNSVGFAGVHCHRHRRFLSWRAQPLSF